MTPKEMEKEMEKEIYMIMLHHGSMATSFAYPIGENPHLNLYTVDTMMEKIMINGYYPTILMCKKTYYREIDECIHQYMRGLERVWHDGYDLERELPFYIGKYHGIDIYIVSNDCDLHGAAAVLFDAKEAKRIYDMERCLFIGWGDD